jgi:endonuclease/exonuclease/phosphatase family metal-dependent hydrolase
MSYNVQLFGLYNFELKYDLQNRDSILRYIEKENPDIICFQEFYYNDKPTNFDTKDTLISSLKIKDYHEKYSFNKNGNRHFGITTLSKHKIISKGDVVFEDDKKLSEDNYCIYTDIIKNKDTFRVYNIHFQSIKFKKEEYALFSPDKEEKLSKKKSALMLMIAKLRKAFPIRANQALTLIDHVNKSPYPVIICGDFNDTPLSFTYNQFNGKYVDAFRNNGYGIGKTFVGKIPAGRIDYIFHSKNLNSYQFKLQEEVFSDHRAISCKVYKKQ